MVSVIIPALNEEKTISDVIKLAKRSSLVSEILVIDDKSLDNTLKVSRKNNVKIYTSTKLGKGTSMREGMLLASNEVIVYLDADILTYPENIVDLLSAPVINNEADFVKSSFSRQAGRVTELVAKPLLSFLFPYLAKFSQPLSGMIAGKKELFKKAEFENDYGVDIGILIDMYTLNARISEVNIGHIENRMQSWEQLGKMAHDVSRAILKRVRKIDPANLETLEKLDILRSQMDFAIRESIIGRDRMIIFDMDNTLLEGSFITAAADAFNFKDELIRIVTENDNAYTRTKLIARNLKGRSLNEILEVVDRIRIVRDTEYVIRELKRKGFITGIISDSYDVVTNHIKNKLKMDFSFGNELEFSMSIATGEVKVPSAYLRTKKSTCHHDFCKSNVMREVAGKYNVGLKNIITVGDSENDFCLLRESGTGVAFCSESKYLNYIADKVFSEKTFIPLLDFAL